MTYVLGMFPYPSGAPHLGHVRVYSITDAYARWARRHGHRVLHPLGWDAFGLPAENAARARGVDPAAWTADNVAYMASVFRRLGFSFDQERELDTSRPEYYRWTQWLFLRLWEAGLAERAPGWIGWCPRCDTALADEQVVDGRCWRCAEPVERRRIEAWTLRIRRYAQRLWDDLDGLDGWDPRAVAIQRRWIGRVEGRRAVVHTARGQIALFVPGDRLTAGAIALAPEHPLAWEHADPMVREGAARAVRRSAVERVAGAASWRIPAGFSTAEGLPVWIDDRVVPQHGVEARPDPGDAEIPSEPGVEYALRDWSVGRQRRWGCPIPAVRCERCGFVPVPDAELPVRLEAPLERPCPRCHGRARRETDTLDTFVCSAWYAFRFVDPANEAAPFDRARAEDALPVDVYVGGLDHAAQHLLYFRFVTKVLHDLGWSPVAEPVVRFVCNGMVRGSDGRKMSKSAGNGVDPAEVLDRHPADALRLAILADTPLERDLDWEPEKVVAKARFLERFASTVDARLGPVGHGPPADPRPAAEAIGRLDRDLGALALHLAVTRLYELHAALEAVPVGAHNAREITRDVLLAVSALAPGWAEARWPGLTGSWPRRIAAPRQATVRLVVQVDGRRAGEVEVPTGIDPDGIVALAAALDGVAARVGGRPIRRAIHVPGRLVNLVTVGAG